MWLSEKLLVLSKPDPPAARLVTVTPAAAPALGAKVVWEFSTETATQNSLFQFLVTRNCACRAQLKPTTYCASMVVGAASLRGVMPWLFKVKSDQFWPARTCRPSESQSIVAYMLRIRRL